MELDFVVRLVELSPIRLDRFDRHQSLVPSLCKVSMTHERAMVRETDMEFMMKAHVSRFLLLALTLMTALTFDARLARGAETSVKFAFSNADITQIIEVYAKASGKKFVVDPGVRGKATIHAPEPVPLDEAFNLLASALEANGFSYVERDDLLYVCSARSIQRNMVPIYKEAPPLKPSRMATMILDLKYASAEHLNKYLRILPSKDGEMMPYEPTNQLIVNDYTPNLIRIYKMVQELDRPETKEFKLQQEEWKKNNAAKKVGGLFMKPRTKSQPTPQKSCGADLDCLFED